MTVPLSLPPTRSAAVRTLQGRGCPGPPARCPPAPAALLTQQCSWPWARRLETLGSPWAAAASGPERPGWSWGSRGPELPGAATKVRTPVGRPRPLLEADGRAAPRPLPATAGALGLAITDSQAPESAPGSALRSHRDKRLWRPRRAWTRRGRAFAAPSVLGSASFATLGHGTCQGPGVLVSDT